MIDFNTQIRDLKGGVVKDSGGEDQTLLSVCCTVLLGQFPDESTLEAKEKLLRFKIAKRICNGGDHSLSVEEIALLKKLIAKGYGPLIVGRAFEILDPEEK